MNDNKLLLLILENLQKKEEEKEINEKSFTYAAAFAAAAGKKEFTFQGKKHPVKMSKEKAEKIISEIENEQNEKRKRKKRKKKKKKKKRAKHIKPTKGEIEYRAKKYSAPPKSKRAKGLAKAASLYKQGKVKQAALVRQRMEAGERKKKSFKNIPRSDTKIAENNAKEKQEELKELIEEIYELDLLNNFIVENSICEEEDYLLETEDLDEKRKRKRKKRKKKKKSGKSSKGLSAAVKKSLDKKADRRGLTRGSVYAEFRKGLAAFLSSGSRKGMTAHQWAHARVNSASPSKSWAVVKKKKRGKKKK